jgi:hypothetical protein
MFHPFQKKKIAELQKIAEPDRNLCWLSCRRNAALEILPGFHTPFTSSCVNPRYMPFGWAWAITLETVMSKEHASHQSLPKITHFLKALIV